MAPRELGPSDLTSDSPYDMRVEGSVAMSDDERRAAIRAGDIGFLHSFTTGSAVDGPGVRLVAWTTACMFRCQYCHNPDTWTLSNGIAVPIGRAIEEMRKYAHSLKVMKGGVTLSGGEPLMQDRFAVKLFAGARELGIHTAIETNGYLGGRLSDAELASIDLVILDMKAIGEAQHKHVTGMDNAPVIAFAERLARLRRPMWLRYVLVPGLTDVGTEMRGMARFAAALGVIERVEILPFHQMGRYKWDRLALDYQLATASPPTIEQTDAARGIFRDAGLAVV